MNLRLARVLLCSALALAAPAVAAAQNEDRPPKELWDEFPLEATATPAGATAPPAGAGPQPTPSPLARERDSGGMPTAMLIALLIVAAVVGALAARPAGRRNRGREWSPRSRWALSRPSLPIAGPVSKARSRAEPSAPGEVRPQAKPQAKRAHAPRPPAQRITAEQRRNRFAKPPLSAETCRVDLHNRSVTAHFYATSFKDGTVIARSPHFRMNYTHGDPGPSPPQALDVLVEELTGAGWRQSGSGERPWDLLFRRSVAEAQPAPRRTE